jgi:hypothetical protein
MVRPFLMIAGRAAGLLRDLAHRHFFLAVAWLALTFARVRTASAADANFYVNLGYGVDGSAEACSGEAEFRQNVAKMVGYDPFRADAHVRVSVRVDNSSRGVEGHVEWRNATGARMGERRFVAKDGNCVKLLTEMSFAVGLQIELLRPKASETPASTTTSPTNPPAAAPSNTAPTTPPGALATPAGDRDQVAPSSSRAATIDVGLGPSLAFGLAPSLTGQARLFVGMRRGVFGFEVSAEATLPVRQRQVDGTGFKQNLFGAGAALCGEHGRVAACLLGKVSALRVSGFAVDQPRSPSAFVLHTGVRVAATLSIAARWSALPHFDTLWLLTPHTVELNHAQVWAMPRLAAVAGIDLVARFP